MHSKSWTHIFRLSFVININCSWMHLAKWIDLRIYSLCQTLCASVRACVWWVNSCSHITIICWFRKINDKSCQTHHKLEYTLCIRILVARNLLMVTENLLIWHAYLTMQSDYRANTHTHTRTRMCDAERKWFTHAHIAYRMMKTIVTMFEHSEKCPTIRTYTRAHNIKIHLMNA